MSGFYNNLKEFTANTKNLFLYCYYSLQQSRWIYQDIYDDLRSFLLPVSICYIGIILAMTAAIIVKDGLAVGLGILPVLLGIPAAIGVLYITLIAAVITSMTLIYAVVDSYNDGICVSACARLNDDLLRGLLSSITLTSRERAYISSNNHLGSYHFFRHHDLIITFFTNNNAQDLHQRFEQAQNQRGHRPTEDARPADRESSMRQNTTNTLCLNKIKAKYNDSKFSSSQWVEEQYNEMKAFLAAAYNADPISINASSGLEFKLTL
jgi:hypothetical protein